MTPLFPHSGLPEMLSPDVRIENIDRRRVSGSPPQQSDKGATPPKAKRTLLGSFDPGEEAEITATEEVGLARVMNCELSNHSA